MANPKKIAVCIVAVILVAAVTISFSSYLSEFNNVQSSSQDEIKAITFKNPPVLGSETATVTIVEVGDYQCEMCKLWFEQTRPQIIKNYVDTGKVNLVFIDMPFLGNDSITAAEATYCADEQGKYWDYHAKLYQLQQHVDDGWANTDRLSTIALNMDLNMEEFNECMNSKEYYSKVNFNKQKAKTDLGANSTPTFVIVNTSGDSKRIVGAHPYSTFEEIINAML
jgi:protein-disulfide isomerase|tara:strand:- start:522 stop:1193 length:672 start_codon:yes stop_codon:yes gene_type:complete